MAEFSMNEADNYGGNGGGSFFTLKDDKDKARVRFLYRGVEDVKGYASRNKFFSGGKKHLI